MKKIQMTLFFFLTTTLLSSSSWALQYQDCNLQADFALLTVQDYIHDPDPSVTSQEHTTIKKFYYNGIKNLSNLYETVTIDKSLVSPDDILFRGWVPYFNNSYEISDKHADVFPVISNSSFVISDLHSPSSSSGAWFRAIEKYYARYDGDNDENGKQWIGCLTVVYQTVD